MRMFLPACAAGLLVLTGCASDNAGTDGLNGSAAAAQAKPILAKSGIEYLEAVPAGVTLKNGLTVPKGFTASILLEGLAVPRRLAIAPGGTARAYDVFLSESKADRITVLRMRNGKVAAKSTFTTRTSQPYGITFAKGWVYIGNTDSVVRFPYKPGDLSTNAAPWQVTKLTRGGYNQHWTRNLLASPDGSKIYFTVGSSCNTCEEGDPQRAAISVMNADGTGRRLFATGMRNPVGLAFQPGTNELWAAVNERDNLGDDVPPDYSTRVTDGGFYGWPYAYTDIDGVTHPDPTFGDKKPEMVRNTRQPTVPVQAHSANLGIAFYSLKGGTFPTDYAGDAFLTFHGSWNRSVKTGYKLVRVHFKNGKPLSVTDFVRGFLDNGKVWGRPVDVQVAPDGSVLFTDDGRGRVWRVKWVGGK